MLNLGIPCAFHNQEIITNFCKAENCLLPLCPKCIKLHVSQHRQQNTQWNIQRFYTLISIDSSIKEVRLTLQNIERLMNRSGQQLSDIQSQKEKINATIKNKFKQARQRILKQVDRSLQKQQDQILKMLNDFDQQIHFQLSDIDYKLRLTLQKLWQMLDGLSNQKCLKNLITFHSTKFLDQVDYQFQKIQQRIHKTTSKRFDLILIQKQVPNIRNSVRNYFFVDTSQQHLKIRRVTNDFNQGGGGIHNNLSAGYRET